ncbi:hypothetical protein BJ875DRAFT_371856 [Amylocarpus encephaloides]|uniref:DUF4604 domain-containing protein n=1 Tax=Amylocarpus encephaloides TaxID=45428 RepID=A0A9P7YMT8_9HELO|nr:hypothetical protein BJ875DRAFT_371856 [Amylocarpus encephaloides]
MATPKITTKNLSYDDSLPPFLARLKAATGNNDRHEYAVARPKKERTVEDLAEDEPVFVDEESGETVTKAEWEEREKAKEAEGKGEDEDEKGESNDRGLTQEKKDEKGNATIGASRKRKVGKIIGAEEDEDAAYEKAMKHKPSSRKKKAKKVKLSFGDDE